MREARLGNSTLSSLALPILVLGSYCSRSMLNLADIPGRMSEVRNSLASGSAVERSIAGTGGGVFFCLRLRLLKPDIPPASPRPSLVFFLLLKTFMLTVRERPGYQRAAGAVEAMAQRCWLRGGGPQQCCVTQGLTMCDETNVVGRFRLRVVLCRSHSDSRISGVEMREMCCRTGCGRLCLSFVDVLLGAPEDLLVAAWLLPDSPIGPVQFTTRLASRLRPRRLSPKTLRRSTVSFNHETLSRARDRSVFVVRWRGE